jgi:sulfane dehydrogenase subunit SoxC
MPHAGATNALRDASIVAFAATADLERADAFYAGVLGLERTETSPFAYVYDGHGSPLRVTLVEQPQAAAHTVLGWTVPDLDAEMARLSERGVTFARYEGLGQNAEGVWTAPGGSRIAWFHDPDGNTLSLQEQPARLTPIGRDELQLAARNHGMPQEALRFPITPAGMHYLLTHYDVPRVDRDGHRLAVDGLVRTPLSLSVDELRRFNRVELEAAMECAGNGRALLAPRAISQPWLLDAVGNARWGGIRLADVLERAGIEDTADELVFTGLDEGVEAGVRQHYARSLTVAEALKSGAVIAFAMNGEPLPPQHGFPLRLVVPGWYGMTNVKWLASITAIAGAFDGYQNTHAYRIRRIPDDPGEPVTRIAVRSLIAPPGVPDFLSRERSVAAGPCPIEGRAWSGWAPIARVEVSTDGGESWRNAAITERGGSDWAWVGWRFEWDATPGRHTIASRATDAAGNTQPLLPEWNVGGYANNAVQRMQIEVREG